MKLALFTLMSCCLIALSWQQQHHHYRQPAANPYWPLPYYQQQQQQHLPHHYQEPYQNYPSFNPYYRGPYSPSAQFYYPDYYQPQPPPKQPYYYKQQQVPHRQYQQQQMDDLKLAAFLSQLSQQQAPEQQQTQDEAYLLSQLNQQTVQSAQQQQPSSNNQPIDDETLLKQLLAVNDEPTIQGSYDDLAELVARYPGILEQNKHQLAAVLATEGRGFLWPALFVGAQILSTSTKYTYTTSTITSTSVISCIVSASFYGGSTQSCRRKRAAAEIEANEDQMPFNPSAVISVENSAAYGDLDLNRESRSAELLSSFEQAEDRSTNSMDGVPMSNVVDNFIRANRAGLFGATVTSTLTTYSISTTSSKKTVSIGSSLSCLPSGYSVC